jgi:hypothetical protein
MRISIQEYFGDEVLNLKYSSTLATPKEKTLEVISEIVEVYGHSLMGVDEGVINVRLSVIPEYHNIYKRELSEMISKLNWQFV